MNDLQQMVDTKDNFRKWGDYLITREFDDILVDEGICDDMDSSLCFGMKGSFYSERSQVMKSVAENIKQILDV